VLALSCDNKRGCKSRLRLRHVSNAGLQVPRLYVLCEFRGWYVHMTSKLIQAWRADGDIGSWTPSVCAYARGLPLILRHYPASRGSPIVSTSTPPPYRITDPAWCLALSSSWDLQREGYALRDRGLKDVPRRGSYRGFMGYMKGSCAVHVKQIDSDSLSWSIVGERVVGWTLKEITNGK